MRGVTAGGMRYEEGIPFNVTHEEGRGGGGCRCVRAYCVHQGEHRMLVNTSVTSNEPEDAAGIRFCGDWQEAGNRLAQAAAVGLAEDSFLVVSVLAVNRSAINEGGVDGGGSAVVADGFGAVELHHAAWDAWYIDRG